MAKNLFDFLKKQGKRATPTKEPKPEKPKKPPKPEKPDDRDTDPAEATKWRYSQLSSLGIEVEWVEQWKAIKAIGLLRQRKLAVEEVAEKLGIKGWTRVEVSKGQKGMMWHKGIPDWLAKQCRCKRDAGLLISAKLEADKLRKLILADLKRSRNNDDVTAIGLDVMFVKGVIDPEIWKELVAAGRQRREEMGAIPQ